VGSTHMEMEMIMFRNIQETIDVQYRSVYSKAVYGNFLLSSKQILCAVKGQSVYTGHRCTVTQGTGWGLIVAVTTYASAARNGRSVEIQ